MPEGTGKHLRIRVIVAGQSDLTEHMEAKQMFSYRPPILMTVVPISAGTSGYTRLPLTEDGHDGMVRTVVTLSGNDLLGSGQATSGG